MRSVLAVGATFLIGAQSAFADACDYRPSSLLGESASWVAGSVGGAVSTGGAAFHAAGFYTLVHSTSGLTMLGSSVAGTIGIIGGTGGVIGTGAAIISAPATITVGAVVAATTGGFEAYCAFLVDIRVTDYTEVEAILRTVAANASPDVFTFYEVPGENSVIQIALEDEEFIYRVADLYFVEGALWHRAWGRNEKVGRLAWIVPESKTD